MPLGMRSGPANRYSPDVPLNRTGINQGMARNPFLDPFADYPTDFPANPNDPWIDDTRPNLFWSDFPPQLLWNLGLGTLPRVPGVDDFADDIAAVEQATMDRGRALLDPVFAQREATMNERLANRGLPTGSAVSNITRDEFGRELSSAYENLATSATLAGRQEHQRLYDLGMRTHQQALRDRLAQVGLSNQAREQAWREQMGVRGQLFQELMGQLGASNFDPFSFLTDPGMDPTNFLGALLSGGAPGSSAWGNLGGLLAGLDWESIFGGGDGDDDTTGTDATAD